MRSTYSKVSSEYTPRNRKLYKCMLIMLKNPSKNLKKGCFNILFWGLNSRETRLQVYSHATSSVRLSFEHFLLDSGRCRRPGCLVIFLFPCNFQGVLFLYCMFKEDTRVAAVWHSLVKNTASCCTSPRFLFAILYSFTTQVWCGSALCCVFSKESIPND